MARKLFSFLGTGKYEPCYYYFNAEGERIVDDHHRSYVQESLVNLLPKAGKDLKEVVIFLTQEAWDSNWVKNNNKKYDAPGLKGALEKYAHTCTITPIKIPSGQSPEELWQIFDKIFEQVDPGDEIIFDITHSFRSMPILATIILNYAKFVRGCDIGGIYYGAIEALGPIGDLKQMPLKDRLCPIFDITAFVDLLDWTVAIDKFVNTGDVRHISAILEGERNKFGEAKKREKASFFASLKNSIHSYAYAIGTCRGKELSPKALGLKKELEQVIENPKLHLMKPIRPLLARMVEELEPYGDNEHINMLEVVQWCLDRDLTQQGITILQEGVVTFLCERYGLDFESRYDRELITKMSTIKVRKIPYEEWLPSAKQRKACVDKALQDEFFNDMAKVVDRMTSIRNDINHGGWNKEPLKPKNIKDQTKDVFDNARDLIYREFNLK